MRTLENPGVGPFKKQGVNASCNDVVILDIREKSNDTQVEDTAEDPENEVGKINEVFEIGEAANETGIS